VSLPGPITWSLKVPEMMCAAFFWSASSAAIMPNMVDDSGLTGSMVLPPDWNVVGSEPTNWGVWLILSAL
jgi:hypothetical protein